MARSWPPNRTRLRNKHTGKQEQLQSYRTFQQPQTDQIYERLLGGLSSRRYDHTVEQVVEGYGTSRWAVSRQMITATAAKLKQLLARDLSGFDVRVLLIDAVKVGPAVHTVVVGLDSSGSRVQIQRCQVHKLRNVLSYLPEHLHAEYRRKLTAAWAMNSMAASARALEAIVKELERINSSAGESLREGLEETLTVHRLALSAALRQSLRSTNMIESMFSGARHRLKNVRHWRNSEQSSRWTAAALLEAEKAFRRIKGCQDMPELIAALNSSVLK